MKSVAIAVACALLACGDTPRPVSHPKYGYFSGPTITGTVTSVTAGSGLTGGTIVRSGTIAVDTSTTQSRVSGTCTGGNAIQTINADGTVTCVAAGGGGGGGGSVTSVGTGTGLTGGPITTTGTVALANTAVTAGSYTLPAITVNAQGQLTAASSYAGTSCGAGTAIQLLNAAGAASCVTVGSGTVTSVATTAPITGGTITTGGTIGLSESSNLRTNAGALDLSTAVVMPGSLTAKDLAGTTQTMSTSGTTVDVSLSSSTTVIDYTGTADASWEGLVNSGDDRWVYVNNATTHVITLIDLGGAAPAADRIKVPEAGSDGFQIPPNSGTWIHYDASSSLWRLSGLIATTCSAGTFIDQIRPDGSVVCAAPTGTVAGSGTTGDLMEWSGPTAATNYGGSTASACTSGSVVTDAALSAAGILSLTCGITPITNSAGTNTITKSDGTNIVGSRMSDTGTGNVAVVGTGLTVCQGCGNSTQFGTTTSIQGANPGTAITIGTVNTGGITIGQSTNPTTIAGAATVDGNTIAGNGAADTLKATGNVGVATSTTPTLTSCGSGTPTVNGSNASGTITWGTSAAACTLNFSPAWTSTPDCVAVGFGGNASQYVSAISASSVTFNFVTGNGATKLIYHCFAHSTP